MTQGDEEEYEGKVSRCWENMDHWHKVPKCPGCMTDELLAERARNSKRPKGTACLKHDLTFNVVCGYCAAEREKALVGLLERAKSFAHSVQASQWLSDLEKLCPKK